jgi:hypothetical protein
VGDKTLTAPGITSGITPGTLGGMGDGQLSRKARENRARRAARRQGLRLRKNPRRDARAVDYGSYMLTDPGSGGVVADFGWDHAAFGDHLADVEEWLARGKRRAAHGLPPPWEDAAAGGGDNRGEHAR